MIILQIIAMLLLVPLTLLTLLIFNVYVTHWLYQLFAVFFMMIYSLLWGLVFLHFNVAVGIFMLMLMVYIIRMSCLARRLYSKKMMKYPAVRGRIKSRENKLRMTFLVPLSFLKIIKLLPDALNRELSRKTGLDIELSQLVDKILEHSKGTLIDIKSGNEEVYIEIK